MVELSEEYLIVIRLRTVILILCVELIESNSSMNNSANSHLKTTRVVIARQLVES